MADLIRVSDWPQLYNTLLVAAFSGWNDAADAATTAVDEISKSLKATPFATIDQEEFYVFSDTRPTTHLKDSGARREISWPTNQFSYVPEFAGQNRSLVTLVGVEPDLKWRTFGDLFFEICKKCNVTEVVLVGSLLAPVPHTRQVPLTAASSNSEIQARLQELGSSTSRYEGPTGIVGVLTARSQEEGLQIGSIWGAAPSYLSASPNWKVASRLMEALDLGWQLNLDLEMVQRLGMRFEAQVSEAVGNQADVAAFVHELEEHYDEDDFDDSDDDDDDDFSEMDVPRRRDDEDNELPNAQLLIQELEKQLNLRRDDDQQPPKGPRRQ